VDPTPADPGEGPVAWLLALWVAVLLMGTLALAWSALPGVIGHDSAVTDVAVTSEDAVTAFVDSSGRRPDHLVRAEAIRAGNVIGTVLPPT